MSWLTSQFPSQDNQLIDKAHHQENMSMKSIPPHTPLLYSKVGVYRGIPIFLMFVPKHRLWVHVRTASAVLTRTHNQYVKNVKNFPMKF